MCVANRMQPDHPSIKKLTNTIDLTGDINIEDDSLGKNRPDSERHYYHFLSLLPVFLCKNRPNSQRDYYQILLCVSISPSYK